LKLALGLGQGRFAASLSLFSQSSIFDVESDGIPFDDIAAVIVQRYAADPVPSVLSVGSSQALFQLERLARSNM